MDLGRTSMMSRALGVNAKSGSPKKLRDSTRHKRMQARMHLVVILRRCLAGCFVLILVVVVPALVIRARRGTTGVQGSFLDTQQQIMQAQTFNSDEELYVYKSEELPVYHSDVELPVYNSTVISSLEAEVGSTTDTQDSQATYILTDTDPVLDTVFSDSISRQEPLPPPNVISTVDPPAHPDAYMQYQQHQDVVTMRPPVLRGNDGSPDSGLGVLSDASDTTQHSDLQLPVTQADDQLTLVASDPPTVSVAEKDKTMTVFLIPEAVAEGETLTQPVDDAKQDALVANSTQSVKAPYTDPLGAETGDISASILYDVPEEQEAAEMVHDYMQAAHVSDEDMYALRAGHLDHHSVEDDEETNMHDSEDTNLHDTHAFDAYSEELISRGGYLGKPGKEATIGGVVGDTFADTVETITDTIADTITDTIVDTMDTHSDTIDAITGAVSQGSLIDDAGDVTGLVEQGVSGIKAMDHIIQQISEDQQHAQVGEAHTVDATTESFVSKELEIGHQVTLGGTDNDDDQVDRTNNGNESEDVEEDDDDSQGDGASGGLNADDHLKAKAKEKLKQVWLSNIQNQEEDSNAHEDLSDGGHYDHTEVNSAEEQGASDSHLVQDDSNISTTAGHNLPWKANNSSVELSSNGEQLGVDDSSGTGQQQLGQVQKSAAAQGTAAGGADSISTSIASLRHSLEGMKQGASQNREQERQEETEKRDLIFEEDVELFQSLPFYVPTPISQMFASAQPARHSEVVADRKPLSVFVGIFTAASSKAMFRERRQAIRDTWLPTLAALPDVDHAFVVGTPKNREALDDIHLEEEEHGGPFLILDAEDCYNCLPEKTLSFLLTVRERYDVKWVLKIDDDVFLSPERLLNVVQQWTAVGADYVGCMKNGGVHGNDNDKWYEPLWRLISEEYYMHAYGSAYAVSSQVLDDFVAPNHHLLRKTRNEDTTVGLWMLMFNTTFFEDLRMCQKSCGASSLIVSQYSCTGLCNPAEDQHLLWDSPECSTAPALAASITDENPRVNEAIDVIGSTHEDTQEVSDVEPRSRLPFVPPPDWWTSHSIFSAMLAAVEQ